MTLVWRPGFQFDADASTYIEAVEVADGQALETGVRYAINDFVIGCKQDGIWDAIKASCILAGARTLNGALVPLVGTAPTNYNFVTGDYNRETGLKGDGSTKYLNTNLAGTSVASTSNHLFVSGEDFPVTGLGFRGSLGSYSTNDRRLNLDLLNPSDQRAFKGPTADQAILSTGLIVSGTVSGSRLSSNLSKLFQNGISVATNTVTASATMPSPTFYAYGLNLNGTPVDLTAARFNFYSIGDGLTDSEMMTYHARVTDLMTAIGAAIP